MRAYEINYEQIVEQIEEALKPEASIAVAVVGPDGIKVICDCSSSNLMQAIYALTSTNVGLIPGNCNCEACVKAQVILEEIKVLLRDHYEIRH
jgi:hypothetical protein